MKGFKNKHIQNVSTEPWLENAESQKGVSTLKKNSVKKSIICGIRDK